MTKPESYGSHCVRAEEHKKSETSQQVTSMPASMGEERRFLTHPRSSQMNDLYDLYQRVANERDEHMMTSYRSTYLDRTDGDNGNVAISKQSMVAPKSSWLSNYARICAIKSKQLNQQATPNYTFSSPEIFPAATLSYDRSNEFDVLQSTAAAESMVTLQATPDTESPIDAVIGFNETIQPSTQSVCLDKSMNEKQSRLQPNELLSLSERAQAERNRTNPNYVVPRETYRRSNKIFINSDEVVGLSELAQAGELRRQSHKIPSNQPTDTQTIESVAKPATVASEELQSVELPLSFDQPNRSQTVVPGESIIHSNELLSLSERAQLGTRNWTNKNNNVGIKPGQVILIPKSKVIKKCAPTQKVPRETLLNNQITVAPMIRTRQVGSIIQTNLNNFVRINQTTLNLTQRPAQMASKSTLATTTSLKRKNKETTPPITAPKKQKLKESVDMNMTMIDSYSLYLPEISIVRTSMVGNFKKSVAEHSSNDKSLAECLKLLERNNEVSVSKVQRNPLKTLQKYTKLFEKNKVSVARVKKN